MEKMLAINLLHAVDEFRGKLKEHKDLWAQSLSQPMPSYPVKNKPLLEAQIEWLTRRLGAVRPYINRFDGDWIMGHAATGTHWDALDSAISAQAVSQVKGPSLRISIEKLNAIAGRLETIAPDTIIVADLQIPIGQEKPSEMKGVARESYVSSTRLEELRQAQGRKGNWDLQRLIRLCEELNAAHAAQSWMSVAILLRAIKDHVPPIFGKPNFEQVVNNMSKSRKELLGRLQTSLKHIADTYLHEQIRTREALPSATQVDFRPEFDALLGEVVGAIV